MTNRGISEAKARELLAHLKPGQEIMDQLEYVDSLIARDQRRKLENPPGLYVFYIRDNIAPPTTFWSSRKETLRTKAQQLKNIESARNAKAEIKYEEYRDREVKAFATEVLPRDEYEKLFNELRSLNRSTFRGMSEAQMDDLTHGTVRAQLQSTGRVKLLSFEEFIANRIAST